MLQLLSGVAGLTKGTATAEVEEGGGHGRSVCPETLGLHAGCNDSDNGLLTRKGEAILKRYLSYDRGLQLALANMESLVTARHNRAVNTSLLLAHTARRFIEVGFVRGDVSLALSNTSLATREKS